MTSETGSRPVLIVAAEQMPLFADWRSDEGTQELPNKALMLQWLDNVVISLAAVSWFTAKFASNGDYFLTPTVPVHFVKFQK